MPQPRPEDIWDSVALAVVVLGAAAISASLGVVPGHGKMIRRRETPRRFWFAIAFYSAWGLAMVWMATYAAILSLSSK